MNGHYLFRALRIEEIDAGCVLIPKSQEPFVFEIKLGVDTRFPWTFGANKEHAVRQHQWKQSGFPTRGISTTPHLERAKFYAQKEKIIIKIDREFLSKHGIKEYAVKDWLVTPLDIAVPEDDEVILVMEDNGPFPKEIIVEIIHLD